MTGLLMVIATAVTADSYASQSLSQYSIRLVAEQSNPWALPRTSEEFLEPQLRTRFRWQSKAQPKRPDAYRFHSGRFESGQMGRFVTPEYLESLKQQQMLMQVMPENRQYNQQMQTRAQSTQAMPQQSGPILPGQGYYGLPLYDMGNINPLYDTPEVSPWGSGSDLIYRGNKLPGSFSDQSSNLQPWVPNEALGGLPPIHIPQDHLFMGGEGDTDKDAEDKVFNPYTFLPYRRP